MKNRIPNSTVFHSLLRGTDGLPFTLFYHSTSPIKPSLDGENKPSEILKNKSNYATVSKKVYYAFLQESTLCGYYYSLEVIDYGYV